MRERSSLNGGETKKAQQKKSDHRGRNSLETGLLVRPGFKLSTKFSQPGTAHLPDLQAGENGPVGRHRPFGGEIAYICGRSHL